MLASKLGAFRLSSLAQIFMIRARSFDTIAVQKLPACKEVPAGLVELGVLADTGPFGRPSYRLIGNDRVGGIWTCTGSVPVRRLDSAAL